LPFPDVILDDRVAAGEAVLLAKTVKYPLRRMTLLARNLTVPVQPRIDDRNERFQLRPPHRSRAPVAGWLRIRQHLADRVARYVEMLRRLALAHSFIASQANPQIKFHGVNPSSLLAAIAKREKVDDFYAARSNTTPPLPWP